MIQLDYSLLLQIINFVLLIFILDYLLYKPMLGVIDKRKRRLEESEEEIKRLHRAIEEKTADYEEKLRSARIEAMTGNKELLKESSEKAKALLDEANGEISLMTEEFHGKVQEEARRAREILTKQTRLLSVEIAEKVLGRSVK